MPKSVIVTIDDHGHRYKAIKFICPGCQSAGMTGLHMFPVYIDGETKPVETAWGWNGDLEFPTLTPSLLCKTPPVVEVCHSFLTDGVFDFLGDCTHDLVGQKVPIPDLPEWVHTKGLADE